jgi:hypothetical protein
MSPKFVTFQSLIASNTNILRDDVVCVSRGSSGHVPTRYVFHGPGIGSLLGRDFSHPSRPISGSTQPHIKSVPGLLSADKAVGPGVYHPLLSSAEVKERVELYLYSPTGPSWPVLGSPVPFILSYFVGGISSAIQDSINFS